MFPNKLNEERRHIRHKSFIHEQPNQECIERHSSFLEKFKNNQVEMRNKFKKYLKNQRHHFPLANKNFEKRLFEADEVQELIDIRTIRKEKKKIIDEMNQSMNETTYLQHKKSQQLKTFNLLKNKYQKVESLRHQRKEELTELEKQKKKLRQEIRQQKLRYKDSIVQLRVNLQRSKLNCEQRKYDDAEEIRLKRVYYRDYISQQKQIDFENKKLKCQTMRQNQKLVSLTVSRVFQQKKMKVQEVKLQRLFRQMAEKQEIKISSSRMKEVTGRQFYKLSDHTTVLENKIKQFRTNLGEKRLPNHNSKRNSFYPKKRHSLTQSLQQCSTHSCFPFQVKNKSFTQASEI